MRIAASLSLLLTTACATSLRPVPEGWRSVPEAARIGELCARVACAEKPKSNVRVAGGKLVTPEKELTPAFPSIQSFDVSLERREIVFSARRGDNFDVGLVSLDGSDIHWIPPERVDETDAQWAPRGNKVSYVVHTARGDVVRTVHIPTSAQLSVDFPGAQVVALGWDPPAERYAVVVESPEASQRVQSMKYDGGEKRTVVPPAERLDLVSEPMASALLLRPSAIHYNEKLPLVVWLDDHPLRWSDARAALMRNARVAIAVAQKPPDAAFWAEIDKMPWIDAKRMYFVSPASKHAGRRTRDAGLKTIREDESVPNGFYIDEGAVIRVGKVQSFAAGYIAHELNTNGLR